MGCGQIKTFFFQFWFPLSENTLQPLFWVTHLARHWEFRDAWILSLSTRRLLVNGGHRPRAVVSPGQHYKCGTVCIGRGQWASHRLVPLISPSLPSSISPFLIGSAGGLWAANPPQGKRKLAACSPFYTESLWRPLDIPGMGKDRGHWNHGPLCDPHWASASPLCPQTLCAAPQLTLFLWIQSCSFTCWQGNFQWGVGSFPSSRPSGEQSPSHVSFPSLRHVVHLDFVWQVSVVVDFSVNWGRCVGAEIL